MDAFLHDITWVEPLRSDLLTPIFLFLTWLGYTAFFLAALPLLFWSWNQHATTRLAFLVLFSALLNHFLKDFFQDPRPDASSFIAGQSPTSFGLPSGHTQVSVVFWLWLAIELRKTWAWIAGAILTAGIACSRLYLGVHDVEDVIGGALLGFGALFLYRWMQISPGFERCRHLPVPARAGLIALLFAAAIFFWPVDPVPGRAHLVAGFTLGWLFGANLENHRLHFQRRSPAKTVLAVLLGLLLLAALGKGLETLFTTLDFPAPLARLLGSFAMAFALTFALPLLFTTTRLMKRDTPESPAP